MTAREKMDLQQRVAQRIPYTMPGMEQISPQRTLVYKTVDQGQLWLDVYHPLVYM